MSDEHLTEHLGGEVLGIGGGVTEMDTALETTLEGSFAAAAGVDLGLHHEFATLESRGDRFGLRRSVGNFSGLGGDAEFGKQFSGLVFVDVHGG
jgi:hypothetical protein